MATSHWARKHFGPPDEAWEATYQDLTFQASLASHFAAWREVVRMGKKKKKKKSRFF